MTGASKGDAGCEALLADEIACRLCGAIAQLRFSRDANDGDAVGYYQCAGCGSLETNPPAWLPDVYATSTSDASTPELDTYAVERSLRCCRVVFFVCHLARLLNGTSKLLDWGGGPGLLVRLLRDTGIDAYNHDKYVRNHFAAGFERSDADRYDVITAIEVFEHFPNPASDIEPIFAMQPRGVLISTSLYRGQGADWTYLGPAKSQHVFFYSAAALQWVADRHGYQLILLPNDISLFVARPLPRFCARLLNFLLSRERLTEVLFAAKKKWSRAYDDHQRLQGLAKS